MEVIGNAQGWEGGGVDCDTGCWKRQALYLARAHGHEKHRESESLVMQTHIINDCNENRLPPGLDRIQRCANEQQVAKESGEEECDALPQNNSIHHSTADAQKATTGLLVACHAQEGVIESFWVEAQRRAM